MVVVTKPVAGLDQDEVEAQGKMRHAAAVREHPQRAQREPSSVEARALASVDGLLGQSEVPAPAPADLDDHELPWRTRVDGKQVDLVSADAQPPPEHAPAYALEMRSDLRLRVVTSRLCRRPHPPTLADGAAPGLG